MYRLSLYISKKLLFLLLICTIVISFLMISGLVFQLFNKGATFYNIGEILLLISPDSLAFSMPVGLLIATMLTYNRLSSDHELTAMRSGGINIWQIISTPILLSIILAVLCFILQFYFIPSSKYHLGTKLKSISLENPSLLISEGETVNLFDKQFIYVDKKVGNKFQGVFIKIFDEKERIKQAINAKTGFIFYNKETHKINFPLEQVTILSYKYTEGKLPNIVRVNSEKWSFNYHIKDGLALLKKAKYLDFQGLLARYRLLADDPKSIPLYQDLIFQINKKMVLALSPLALVMIGLAFSLKTGRRETGHSLMITIGLALGYFVLIMLAETVRRHNASLANIIIWFPNISYQLIGIFIIHKISST